MWAASDFHLFSGNQLSLELQQSPHASLQGSEGAWSGQIHGAGPSLLITASPIATKTGFDGGYVVNSEEKFGI